MPNALSHAALVICLLGTTVASAESRPALPNVVRRCVLIVKCRVEIKDKQLNYRVLESWKGIYSPELFEQPPEKDYMFARPLAVDAGRDRVDGREVILFYSDNALGGCAHKPRKLDAYRMDDSLAIVDGKVSWAIEREFGEDEYSLADFKKAVLKFAAKQDGDQK